MCKGIQTLVYGVLYMCIQAYAHTPMLDPARQQDMDFDTWQRQNRGIETNGTNVPDHVQQQVYALVNKAVRLVLDGGSVSRARLAVPLAPQNRHLGCRMPCISALHHQRAPA